MNTLKKVILLLCFLTKSVSSQEIDLVPDGSFLGTHEAERIGYALCGGGDVNGDGLADFAIGTFHNITFGKDAGAAYLVLGENPFQHQMYDSVAWKGIRFLGESKYQAVGYCLANNGDVNGDGFDDLLIGAPAGNPHIKAPGKIYFVYGKAAPDWGYNFVLGTSANGAISGEVDQDRFGVSVAYLGDVNADGFDDFIVGAPDFDGALSGTGKVYFFLGRATGWSRFDLADDEARATFVCKRESANFGFAVAGVGDVNADGIPDFIMGAPGINKAYLMYGRHETDWSYNFDIEENADVIFSGENYNGDMNGYALAGVGDVNGDGISDIAISAIHFRANGQLSGKVYVVFGRENGWNDQGVKLTNADASFNGEISGDLAGWSVAGAGDANGDGFAEILIGMFNEENKKNVPGKAYLVPGKADYWAPNTELRALRTFVGEQNYQLCGFCVSGAGDVDGDQWADFLVAAPYYAPDSSGNVYLFRSGRPQAKISGSINYFQSRRGVPGVACHLTGDFKADNTSDASGRFSFDVFQFADYQLTISPLAPDPECLSAYDAALTARAAVNLESFSEQQRKVADVDANGRVTVFDAALILRAELGLPAIGGSRAGTWRVPDTTFVFSNIQTDISGQTIQLMVYGDVDASWAPVANGFARNRTGLECQQPVVAGETVGIPLNFAADENVLAFDAKLIYDPETLEFSGIEKTVLTNSFTLSHAETKSGEIRLGAFAVEPQQSAGTYANIHFKVKPGFSGKTLVCVTGLKMNDESLPETLLTLFEPIASSENSSFQLLPNFPNPFNSGTRLEYHLARKSQVELVIFNTIGQKICTLIHNLQEQGEYRLNWDGTNDAGQAVPSGIYFIQLFTEDFQQTRKITLLR